MKQNKFSIITPSYNHGEFIEETILSVLNQNYSAFEHIVMDGGSTDNTKDILLKYPHLIWSSGKDRGQGHAINKGFARAEGDIIAWLNSDDYYGPNVFNLVNQFFNEHPGVYCVYGDISYVSSDGGFLKLIKGENVNYRSIICRPDLVRQPATFWRREVINSIGSLDESLHLVMDLDFFLRMFKKYPPGYLEANLAFFRFYAENKTLSSFRRQVKEMREVVHRYERPAPISFYKFLFGRYLDSLPQEHLLSRIFTPLRKKP